jgi:NAD+-dependent protein deacetylase SIR2
VKQQYPDVVLKGRDLFDASLFRDSTSTSVFYTFISKLKQSIDSVSPSPTHHFLKILDLRGKLLRSYTQNIDALEERVGLLGSASEEARSTGKGKGKLKAKEVRNVQLHGDIRRVRCTFCSATFPFSDEYMNSFLDGVASDCPECSSRCELCYSISNFLYVHLILSQSGCTGSSFSTRSQNWKIKTRHCLIRRTTSSRR